MEFHLRHAHKVVFHLVDCASKSATLRFLRLKEHLITLMELPEWATKVPTKLRSGDWDLIAKVLDVLKVCDSRTLFELELGGNLL